MSRLSWSGPVSSFWLERRAAVRRWWRGFVRRHICGPDPYDRALDLHARNRAVVDRARLSMGGVIHPRVTRTLFARLEGMRLIHDTCESGIRVRAQNAAAAAEVIAANGGLTPRHEVAA